MFKFFKKNSLSIERLEGAIKYYNNRLKYHINLDFDGRSIVGDDPNDINDTNYGNPNVIGPDKDSADHGTHVSGIILSIYDNVKIMTLRAVPDGDEYDKDVALAIRYAANNGAKIINTSFGKSTRQRHTTASTHQQHVQITNQASLMQLQLQRRHFTS